jgi:hypothetical protein
VKLELRRIAEQLATEEPCLGAVFCTYTFDPAFFEEQVLRTILRLRSDPDEEAVAFLEEARGALQATPVAVLLDANMRRPGRRLPYDVLLVRARTFHPKLALLVYEKHARLLVGSCNLTRGGYEENLELGFVRTLRYDDPGDALTLREASGFLRESAGWAAHRGTQLALVLDELARRLPSSDVPAAARDHKLVGSFGRPILDQILEAIPADANVTRVGILAPYFETDDAQIGERDGAPSFLAELVERRGGKRVALDLGVSWSDAPLDVGTAELVPLERHCEELWAWRWHETVEGRSVNRIEYLVPTSLGPSQMSYRDSAGKNCRWDRAEVEAALQDRRFWRVPTPSLEVPPTIVKHLAEHHDLQLWLHPSNRFSDEGRTLRRNLHAKLFVLTTERHGKALTYIVLGSPNASRSAMLRKVEDAGNVELAVLLVADGAITLHDLLPSRVRYDIARIGYAPPAMAALDADLSAWIDDAVHDAATESLSVTWARSGPAPLGSWTLRYGEHVLVRGDGAHPEPSILSPFTLRPDSAELILEAGGREWSVPIRIADLATLPTSPSLAQLGLRELLALLGRRIGAERVATLVGQKGSAAMTPVLEAIFGEGFGPVDVFKAWWGLAHDLGQASSLAAFRVHLAGSMGAAKVWARLREQAGQSLSRDEVWLYGAELARTLETVVIADAPDGPAKRAELDRFRTELGAELRTLQPSSEGRLWIAEVVEFYESAVSHG